MSTRRCPRQPLELLYFSTLQLFSVLCPLGAGLDLEATVQTQGPKLMGELAGYRKEGSACISPGPGKEQHRDSVFCLSQVTYE